MTPSRAGKSCAATLREAAELADAEPIFTGRAICLASQYYLQASAAARQYALIMWSEKPWDNDPRIDPNLRVLGLLFAAEFTRTEGLL